MPFVAIWRTDSERKEEEKQENLREQLKCFSTHKLKDGNNQSWWYMLWSQLFKRLR
jgi:hypothetical protein